MNPYDQNSKDAAIWLEKARAAVKSAGDAGFIRSPRLKADEWPGPKIIGSEAQQIVQRLPRLEKRPEMEQADPGWDTRRQQYQQSKKFYYVKDSVYHQPLIPYFFEVGRFVVPDGAVGIVKVIQQWASVVYPATPPVDMEPFCAGNCFDPFTVIRPLGLPIIPYWHLRLEQGAGNDRPWIQRSTDWLEGQVYPELGDWDEILFPWGGGTNDVFWVIPSDSVLRFYFSYSPPNPHDERPGLEAFGGQLVGYTQPAFVESATFNIQHGWSG